MVERTVASEKVFEIQLGVQIFLSSGEDLLPSQPELGKDSPKKLGSIHEGLGEVRIVADGPIEPPLRFQRLDFGLARVIPQRQFAKELTPQDVLLALLGPLVDLVEELSKDVPGLFVRFILLFAEQCPPQPDRRLRVPRSMLEAFPGDVGQLVVVPQARIERRQLLVGVRVIGPHADQPPICVDGCADVLTFERPDLEVGLGVLFQDFRVVRILLQISPELLGGFRPIGLFDGLFAASQRAVGYDPLANLPADSGPHPQKKNNRQKRDQYLDVDPACTGRVCHASVSKLTQPTIHGRFSGKGSPRPPSGSPTRQIRSYEKGGNLATPYCPDP